ncbi:unnamed protein product [Haemonchus placei]|uniref:Ion_trans domain-containing protein n=1 Tax=Haemonchus placei TaxID=6290 RepID=A0A0N4X2M4_HAEPC|nr:unnamed protein product [Haemonchus placei]
MIRQKPFGCTTCLGLFLYFCIVIFLDGLIARLFRSQKNYATYAREDRCVADGSSFKSMVSMDPLPIRAMVSMDPLPIRAPVEAEFNADDEKKD